MADSPAACPACDPLRDHLARPHRPAAFNGFVGEFLVLSGSFTSHPRWVAVAAVGVILSASYMLWMIQRIFYGRESSLVVNRPAPDLDFREHVTLWPMAILMLAMGVLSPYWIKAIEPAMTPLSGATNTLATPVTPSPVQPSLPSQEARSERLYAHRP